MTKKMLLAGMIVLLVVLGANFTAKAESNESNNALKERATKAEKKSLELESRMKGMTFKAKSIDDLDDAEAFLPSIDSSFKNGPAIVIGPKGKVSLWMTLTAASQVAYLVAPTPPYVNWILEGDVWGMKVKVNVMDTTATKLIPEGATFKVGDRVSIQGTMKDGAVTAVKVRNHSLADDKTTEISARIQELMKKMKELCNQITPRPAICGTL